MFIRTIGYSLVFLIGTLQGQEYIKSFKSTVDINHDGSLTVYEKITVVSAQRHIKRGIVRTFPTRYSLLGFFNFNTGFEVTSVRHNGHTTCFNLENTLRGREIHIGDDTRIEPGIHVYEITYTTNRQLGFFHDHDELYWNGIGTAWEFPILKGTVTINLPSEIPADAITAEACVGKYGEKKQDYRITPHNNSIRFSTTQPLGRYEGMTTVVTWPKGFIPEPTWYQKIVWFFLDNSFMIWLVLWLLLALFWYISLFIHSRRQRKLSIVIPLFYPPTGMNPAAVGFLHDKDFNDSFIAPEIVFMAVQGYITIAYDEAKTLYTLSRTSKSVHPDHEPLLSVLFGSQESITINRSQTQQLIRLKKKLEYSCTTQYNQYIQRYTMAHVVGLLCVILATAPLFTIHSAFWPLGLVIAFFFYALMSKMIRDYTHEGQKLADQIAGFKLFLETTETERLKIIGTPPTKTPELYEHYLPYAMVLGVEEAWTRQFTPLFAKLAQEHKPYQPLWYTGPRFHSRAFSRGIHTAVQKSLPQPTGWSSGAGGKGFSGGGGGGGGGRGR